MVCPACGTENDDTADSCFKCGQGFALTEGALLASRYEILSHLGRGGMGIVYKARDHALEETVALKVLRFDLARSRDVARRFRSEIKLARKVRHPNVCGIHEYGEDGIYRFIVMELIEGRDLRRILRGQGAFRPEEATALGIEISEGLQAIHDVGIVHRDLKSPNIMLDVEGRVRLMDFGIAKKQGVEVTSGSATATGLVLGTPEYMSPEQARGKKIDFRSDIYALGVIGYELFTGRVPFKGETPLETLFKQLQEAPVFTGPDSPVIPAPIIPVLRKALAKAPEERYASAGEMARALRQARAEAFGVSPSGVTPRVLISTDRHDRESVFPTRTVSTPTPEQLSSGRPTVTPPRTMSPPETGAPTPTLPTRPSPTSPPVLEPTRIVSTGPTVAEGAARPSRPGSKRSWALASAAGLAVLVAGTLWMKGRDRSVDPIEPSRSISATPTAVPGPAAARSPSPVAEPAPARGEGTLSDARATSTSEREPTPAPRRAAAADAGSGPSAASDRPSAAPAVPAPAPPPVATPEPTPPPVAAAAPEPTPTPPPAPPTLALLPARGRLQLRVLPWAEVRIDGEAMGTTPMRPIELDAGEYTVVLTHPEYKPLQKHVVIQAEEVTVLEVDLGYEAFPAK
jgi:serine/threonine-protein kinase